MLAQQIRHHSHKLDCVIVSSLTDMALSGSESSFNDITQILANLSKLSISPENKPETKELCEAVRYSLDDRPKLHCLSPCTQLMIFF
jgi:phosphatidylinositol 4-kinase